MSADNTKTARIIRLAIMLSGRRYAINEITEILSVSQRTVFRFLNELSQIGFVVERRNGYYGLSKSTFNGLLNRVTQSSSTFSLTNRTPRMETQSATALQLVKVLHDAIEQKKTICLYDYHAAGGKRFPKILEPFLISASDQALWAFDCATNSCKQFKLLRMGKVEILDQSWECAHKHKLPFTDLFNMSAAEPIDTVTLELGGIASNLLAEEYPDSFKYRHPKHDYRFVIPVADYRGAGRFVLGLMDNIKVTGSAGFKNYLRNVVKTYGSF